MLRSLFFVTIATTILISGPTEKRTIRNPNQYELFFSGFKVQRTSAESLLEWGNIDKFPLPSAGKLQTHFMVEKIEFNNRGDSYTLIFEHSPGHNFSDDFEYDSGKYFFSVSLLRNNKRTVLLSILYDLRKNEPYFPSAETRESFLRPLLESGKGRKVDWNYSYAFFGKNAYEVDAGISAGLYRSERLWVYPNHDLYEASRFFPRNLDRLTFMPTYISDNLFGTFQVMRLVDDSPMVMARIHDWKSGLVKDISVTRQFGVDTENPNHITREINELHSKDLKFNPDFLSNISKYVAKNGLSNSMEELIDLSIENENPLAQKEDLFGPEDRPLFLFDRVYGGVQSNGKIFVATRIKDPFHKDLGARIFWVQYEHESFPRIALSFRNIVGITRDFGSSTDWYEVDDALRRPVVDRFLDYGVLKDFGPQKESGVKIITTSKTTLTHIGTSGLDDWVDVSKGTRTKKKLVEKKRNLRFPHAYNCVKEY